MKASSRKIQKNHIKFNNKKTNRKQKTRANQNIEKNAKNEHINLTERTQKKQ